MDTLQVSVSGSIGKQAIATGNTQYIRGFLLDAPISAATVTVRSGNASGSVILSMSAPVKDSRHVMFPEEKIMFGHGMHVKVIGVSANCYVFLA